MERLQKAIFWTVLVSEISHVFCCVLPTIISIVSLLGSLSALSILPASVLDFHDFMHAYEIPVISFSALVLILGWGLYALSIKIDCHNTGCVHEPCGKKKRKTSWILMAATALFCFNTFIYLNLHAG